MAPLPNPEEWLKDALGEAFRALQAQHYDLNTLETALSMILAGTVAMDAKGGISIASASTPNLCYEFPAGSPLACSCQAAQYAPTQPCKHSTAALMYSQATAATTKRLAAWEHEQLTVQMKGCPMPADPAHPLEELVNETPPSPIPTGALETTVTQWQHDPHSITVKGISRKGYEILLCVRGLDLDATLAETEKALGWMQKHDIRGVHPLVETPPTPSTERAPTNGHTQAATETHAPVLPLWDRSAPASLQAPRVRCPVHPEHAMTARQKKAKPGEFYYAHPLGPKQLCFGREA